ncbi:hypothetical protein M7I_8066 [Glarea lozoyensis 74030]|uniref:Uncharacterized protein n=1 Tax=Glarea lozoyensis (strain ATCC 74030 / MF5533) TaxID=1104152 RepID=H0EZ04_GLAL7|nr:hypothetical protein M7I_8066 [Glarea lozoyensis 74030]
MVHVLENEKDHLKHMKRAAIRELLTVPGQDGELNTTDLKEFLKTMSTTLPNGEQLCVNLARRIQERRGRDMAKYGNDREFEERQTRLQKHELNMYGSGYDLGSTNSRPSSPDPVPPLNSKGGKAGVIN